MEIIISQGTWFDYGTDARVCFKIMSPAEVKNLVKESQATKFVFKANEAGQMQRVSWTDTNDEKFSDILWGSCIVDWEGITKDGKEFPCTPENKRFIMDNSIEFVNFANKCLKQLRAAIEVEEEEETKN